MQYQIKHTTEYQYEETVGFTPQLLRLFPRMDDRIRISEYNLTIFPTGDTYWLRDPYDNAIAKFFTQETSKQLSITVNACIEHRQNSAFDFLLDSHAVTFPFGYKENEQEILLPYLSKQHQISSMDTWLQESDVLTEGDTTACLTSIITQLHQTIRYQRRDEPGIQSPDITLQHRSGTCRDYAVLLMAVCSHLGLATRFVSGYLYASNEDTDTLGADALHAWTDVYLPGAGWRGLDPTNGVWCGNCHIPLAVAKKPAETTPIDGSYCAHHHVQSTMKTHLSIQKPSCK